MALGKSKQSCRVVIRSWISCAWILSIACLKTYTKHSLCFPIIFFPIFLFGYVKNGKYFYLNVGLFSLLNHAVFLLSCTIFLLVNWSAFFFFFAEFYITRVMSLPECWLSVLNHAVICTVFLLVIWIGACNYHLLLRWYSWTSFGKLIKIRIKNVFSGENA